jgi:hypothetical protein
MSDAVSWVRKNHPAPNDDVVMTLSLKAICQLIERGHLDSGVIKKESFESWGIDHSFTAEWISGNWKELGRDPEEGELAAFALTSSGKQESKKLRK